MKKKVLATLLAATMLVSLAGCGDSKDKTDTPAADKTNDTATDTPADDTAETPAANDTASGEIEDVALTMWGAEEDQAMLQQMIDAFVAEHASEANITVSLGIQSESTCKDTVLTDIEAAADVYAFADDQLGELVNAGALQPVSIDTEAIIDACGGTEAGAVQAAMVDGQLYAYPATASNGYFMFYDKSYFTDEDVQSLTRMLDVAAAAGKKVTMDWSSGWYIYSLFQGAGLTLGLEEDGVTNFCTWNAAGGTDVAQAMLDISANPGFVSLGDAEFVTGIQDGSIIAGINGTWNATAAEEVWGENYAAVKLPSYTLAGQEVQMSSFAGYKMLGVNAYSKQPGWAMLLAEYITNYDNQVLRFTLRGEGPANVAAAASEEVQASPAIAALAAQSQYATVQRVGGNFWDPVATFGQIMVDGNPDGTDLQVLLDNMVEGIVSPAE